ncbi:unnamed protein product, partial [Linum tenue]
MSYRFLHHPRRQSSLQERHLQYLLLVEDWRRAGRFAWGAAVLSYLYREMGRSALQMTTSSSLGGDFGGWSVLLMIWTWERFPHTSPLHAETGAQITQDAVPRGLRWLPAQTRQHGDQFYLYKLWFDECRTFVDQPHPPHSATEIRFFLRQGQHGPPRGQQFIQAASKSIELWNRRHEFNVRTSYSDIPLAYH